MDRRNHSWPPQLKNVGTSNYFSVAAPISINESHKLIDHKNSDMHSLLTYTRFYQQPGLGLLETGLEPTIPNDNFVPFSATFGVERSNKL